MFKILVIYSLALLSKGVPENKNICGSASTSSNIVGTPSGNRPEHLNDLELAQEHSMLGTVLCNNLNTNSCYQLAIGIGYATLDLGQVYELRTIILKFV